MKPLAILGLDPGTTSAYAAVGLDGKLIQSGSRKEFTLSEIISEIIEFCQPVIVATDKSKIPSFVEGFSRKMGAAIVSPGEDLKKEEKHLLVGQGYKGDHQEDALAAALFAYRKYSFKLAKIRKFIQENSLEGVENEFTRLALKDGLNFSIIRSRLAGEEAKEAERKIMEKVVKDNQITKKDFLALSGKLSSLRKEKEWLESRLDRLKRHLKSIKKENKQLCQSSLSFNQKLDRRLKFKEERLKLQTKEINELSEMVSCLNEKILTSYSFIGKMPKYQLVKKLGSLSYREFRERAQVLNIGDNDVLLVGNPGIYSGKVLEELAGRGIIVVSSAKMGEAIRSKFRTLHLAGKIPYENEYFGLLEREVLEKKVNHEDFMERIIRDYRERG